MREYICDLCGNKFNINSLLVRKLLPLKNKNHIEIMIGDFGNDICDKCRRRILEAAENAFEKIKDKK